MKRFRGLGLVALTLLASLMLVGNVVAGEVEDLKARKAELLKELEKVEGQLEAKGVTATPVSRMMRRDDGQSLLYSGAVELGFGGTWADCEEPDGGDCGSSDLDDENYPFIEGSGRANVPLADNFSLQIDAEGWATFTSRSDGEDNLHDSFSGALHATWRDPSNGAAGVFGQFGSSTGGRNDNAVFWLIGAEGQIYLGDFTLYGQAGYFDADDESTDDVMQDAVFVRGVARWFPDVNTRVQGEFAFASGDENQGPGDSPGADLDAYSWGVRADRIISGYPISLFVSYGGTHVTEDENDGESSEDEYTEHRIMAGVTFHFGVDDLKTQDRRGVTLDTPDLGRWTGITTEIID